MVGAPNRRASSKVTASHVTTVLKCASNLVPCYHAAQGRFPMIQTLDAIQSAPTNNKDGQTASLAHPGAGFRWLVVLVLGLSAMIAGAEQSPTPTPTPHKSRLKAVLRRHTTTASTPESATAPVQNLRPGTSSSRTALPGARTGSTKRLARKAARPAPTPEEPETIDGIYRGKLGTDEIVLEIGESPENGLSLGNPAKTEVTFPVMGRYFRRSVGMATLLVSEG